MGGMLYISLALGYFIVLIVIQLIGGILALYAVTGKLVPGLQLLARVERDLSTASTLVSVGYISGFIMLVVSAVTLTIAIGLIFLVISAILLLVGAIGLIILCLKLNDRFKTTLYQVAGILFIVRIITPFVEYV